MPYQKYFSTASFFICAAIFLFATKQPIHSQATTESLKHLVDSLFYDYGYKGPGSAILVLKDREVLLNQGYGLANLENEISISPSTVFDLGSVSKMFTGYAIASLIQQGRISLDDDIRKYIPELPDYAHID